jgi:2-keto-4-pentenoate hydratase
VITLGLPGGAPLNRRNRHLTSADWSPALDGHATALTKLIVPLIILRAALTVLRWVPGAGGGVEPAVRGPSLGPTRDLLRTATPNRLLFAKRHQVPVLSETPRVPDHDPTDPISRGMKAQLARRDAEFSRGATQVGWKIGFNTPAIQEHFGLTEPVVGYLLDQAVAPDGATIDVATWTNPAVEVEVAVRVGKLADGSPTVAGLAPALELVDLGISFDEIEPVLGANICQRGVIFGDEVTDVDPFTVTVTATKNDEGARTGSLVEDPLVTATFVDSFLSAHGAALEPGQRIIAGSLIAPIAVAPGDSLSVTFGPLGALSVRFT